MGVNKNYTGILTKLGLSVNEAKVYLGTLRAGTATAKVISQNSSVGREDVYRVLPSLQERGLVRKYIDSPAKYEATAPDEAMKILLVQREEQERELQTEATEFSSMHFDGAAKKSIEDEKIFVVSRDNKTGVDPELIKLIRETRKTLDFTTRYKLFSVAFNEPGLTDWINEMYYSAQRGVKFRMVMDNPETTEPISESKFSIPNSKRLLTHPNFDYRYISESPRCIMILFDGKASCIEVSCRQETKMSPYMVTSNPVFATVNAAYFEVLWKQAQPPVMQHSNELII
jgi:sugar-specific transcriptional regulator TrmB